ncbi:MAG: helix-turn-helix domain-containing protein [Actinobacteria bacterium]|nr:helix-turn-helix domain-containing protein [Actinomycetota bacterium]
MLPLSTHEPTSGAPSMPAAPLSLPEREEIRASIERGESLTAAADRLGRHRCTVSAEVARNGGRDGYRAAAAQARARRSRCWWRRRCWPPMSRRGWWRRTRL